MTNAELKKLETLHEEAEQTAAAFYAIAIRAEAGSETAKQPSSSGNWQTTPLIKQKASIKPVLLPTNKANGTKSRSNQPDGNPDCLASV